MKIGKSTECGAEGIKTLFHPAAETIGVKTQELEQSAIVIDFEFSPQMRFQEETIAYLPRCDLGIVLRPTSSARQTVNGCCNRCCKSPLAPLPR